MTHSFTVADMTCGHCARRITAAVSRKDSTAKVQVDLARRVVRVEGGAEREDYAKAIRDAGYTPEVVAS